MEPERSHSTGAGRAARRSGRGSELERTREGLRSLQRRFRSIIERTPEGIMVVDAEGIILFANASAEEIFGRSRTELVGAPLGLPLVADERAEIDIARNGDGRGVELRTTETEWEGHSATLVSFHDITDRQRAEAQARRLLREQAARAEAEETAKRSNFLSEASRRLFSCLDPETTLHTVVSLAAEEFADFCVLDAVEDGTIRRYSGTAARDSRGDLLRLTEAYPLDPESDTPQARVFRDEEPLLVGEVTDEWLRSATRDREHFELGRSLGIRSLLCVPLCTGRRCVGTFTAVRWRHERFTERDCEMAAELGRRAGLAIENSRLYHGARAGNRAKSNFLAVMSHELRTPLSAIIGYTDLLDREIAGPTTDKQKRFLARIRSGSNHLLQIIEEVLAFADAESNAERVRVDELSLGDLMDDVLTLAEPLEREAPAELHVDIADPRAPLRTDSRKLRQILINLISNAFKFTPEGEVRVGATVDGDDAVFVVEDTGVGIPVDSQDAIFEKFWQVEDPRTRRAGGTGLGLAVARAFARMLGGDIAVDSVPDVGSTFTVRVPARHDSAGAAGTSGGTTLA